MRLLVALFLMWSSLYASITMCRPRLSALQVRGCLREVTGSPLLDVVVINHEFVT